MNPSWNFRCSLFGALCIIMVSVSCTPKKGGQESPLREHTLSGKVISIIDGDTYDVLLPDHKTIRVRMEGIDAPERGMPFYRKSKQYLASLCFKQQVTLEVTGEDHHHRVLAFTRLEDGRELSREMLKAGMAWHFKKYNNDSALAGLETEARAQRIGLWNEKDPMPPWTNRELHRKGISTKDSFDIKVP
ncbi:MAG TPA: thermonuclease family protein [Bacteroidales bacterium]|nr:thermonuclease family protein [Bacteroidales bacterium]HRZ48086.1 thermonuclease family protein [Bacteroidales bacterium]